jgi:tRNA G18 (ribose-2'-O)-methylase SpoU
MTREETRRERYTKKEDTAISLPLSIVTINFDFDDNLAFLIRTAACFGVRDIYVLGSVPPRKFLHPKSGSLSDYYSIKSFSNPSKFLTFARANEFKLISAEISEKATSLYDYKFSPDKHTCIVLGNETTGIPVEILLNSELVYIPMNGVGFCLNTSQTGTAFVNEYCRQYFKGIKI